MSPDHTGVMRLSDELVVAIAAARPIAATLWGIPGHDGRWDDLSPEGHDHFRGVLASFERRVPTAPAANPWEELARTVLVDFLALERDRYAHGDHLADLNVLASPFQIIRIVFDVMDGATEAGWEHRIARLETIGDVLDGYRRSLDRGSREGNAVAARQVRAVIEQARVHAGDRSFFHTLPAALTTAGVGEPRLAARLAEAVPRACAVYAAFAEWLDAIYLPRARLTDAVGRERYVREARRFLGMDLDPDDAYGWGWREIARIRAQMERLALAIAPGKTVGEVLGLLKTDPTYAAPDVPAFIDLMRARQAEALAQLADTHFDVPEAMRVLEVRRAPPGGPLGAYYTAPSDGFTRPGTVWYSLDDGRVPLFDEISTAYHEGFPGHHLQIGTQIGLVDRLSRLHRVADGYSGYAEGWALYAEQLMDELGFFERPEYRFGMLACQMIRACRVVIDIGAHLDLQIPADQPFHPGETLTFAIGEEMLVAVGGLQPSHATSEMTRYLGWPGQAISYKLGQRVILDLRDAERARLGPTFDVRDFHRRVLGCGNVGLARLAQIVTPA